MRFIKLENILYIWALNYFALSALLHWRLHPDLGLLFYFIGSVIGLHLLSALEYFILSTANSSIPTKSPLKSIVLQLLLIPVTLFILTSTGSRLGAGIVLQLNLEFLFWQWNTFKKQGTLANWWNGTLTISVKQQQYYLYALAAVFLLETSLFVLI